MKSDVGQMIAHNRVPPHAVFKPESAMQQRVILLGSMQIEPDSPETVERLQVGPCQVTAIVPEQAPAQGGQVGDESREEDHRPKDGVAESDRRGLGVRRLRGAFLQSLGRNPAPIWSPHTPLLRHKLSYNGRFEYDNDGKSGLILSGRSLSDHEQNDTDNSTYLAETPRSIQSHHFEEFQMT